MQTNEVDAGFSQKIHTNKTYIEVNTRNYRINVHMRTNGSTSCWSKSSHNIENPIGNTSLKKKKS